MLATELKQFHIKNKEYKKTEDFLQEVADFIEEHSNEIVDDKRMSFVSVQYLQSLVSAQDVAAAIVIFKLVE